MPNTSVVQLSQKDCYPIKWVKAFVNSWSLSMQQIRVPEEKLLRLWSVIE